MVDDGVIFHWEGFSPEVRRPFRFASRDSNDLFYLIQDKALAPINTITSAGVPRRKFIAKASTGYYTSFGPATYFQPLIVSVPEC
ncbi:hypothetical protein N7488_007406 [Penicillium malachiteum]|nr:hypothetical protein N7488_007406 [Penicillium malachiteum]